MSEPLLRVIDLVKHFPIKGGLLSREAERVHAVDGVSLEIGARGCHHRRSIDHS